MDVDLKSKLEPGVHEGFDWQHAPIISIAISLKRIADALEPLRLHHAPPDGQAVGGFSQAEHNINDLANDRFSDLAQKLRSDT